jgi:hypothetical protein
MSAQTAKDFEYYARDCVKLAEQPDTRPRFGISCSKWLASGCRRSWTEKTERLLSLPTSLGGSLRCLQNSLREFPPKLRNIYRGNVAGIEHGISLIPPILLLTPSVVERIFAHVIPYGLGQQPKIKTSSLKTKNFVGMRTEPDKACATTTGSVAVTKPMPATRIGRF